LGQPEPAVRIWSGGPQVPVVMHIELPRKPADRVVMALVCPIMFAFLAVALLAVEWCRKLA
jgi:hypothetical protein